MGAATYQSQQLFISFMPEHLHLIFETEELTSTLILTIGTVRQQTVSDVSNKIS
jgi:hypothetical protein